MTSPDRNPLLVMARRIVQLQGQVASWAAFTAMLAFFNAVDDRGLDRATDLLACAVALVAVVNALYARSRARAGIVDMILRSLDRR